MVGPEVHRLPADGLERPGNSGCVSRCSDILAQGRPLAGRDRVENSPEGVDVAGRTDLVETPLELLRAHIMSRP